MRRGQAEIERRRNAAEERAESRASRTAQQQLELLDERLGKEAGAYKERARLEKQLNNK